MMKIATGLLAALLLLSGCGYLLPEDEARISVRFKAGIDIKSLPDDECIVERLDLLAFRSVDGVIDTYASCTGHNLDGISADVSAGYSLNWHIVANAPSGAFVGITREEDFLTRNTLLAQTTDTTLVMHGEGNNTFSAGDAPITVLLKRYVSKVSIGSVRVSWLDGYAIAPECILETVALVNARGQICWSGIPSASADGLWYNRSCLEELEGNIGACLIRHPNLSLGISAVNVDEVLYSMPNPSECSDNALVQPWAPRRTRIVLGIRTEGILQWYPIDLPSMEGNTHYRVENLIISGPGASQPDGAIDRSSISFNVELRPWGSNTSNVDFGTN